MKADVELKLQAWLDGEELSTSDHRQLEELLGKDESLKNLHVELKSTREVLRGNEPQHRLNASREFYWNQIKREITRQANAPAAAREESGWKAMLNWRRLLAPLGSLAALTAAVVLVMQQQPTDPWTMAEVENLSPEATTMTFRFPSENMFVVWVSTSGTEEQPTSRPIAED
jgi:negative regulator of sigma E activity